MSTTQTRTTEASRQSTLVAAPRNSGLLQRKCACGGTPGPSGECAECQKKKLLQRRASASTAPGTAPSIVHDVLRSPGQPLDLSTRAFFEPRFGHDFSKVRVHTDARAAESARSVNALAYTSGQDIVFANGQHGTASAGGLRLLAHELTHVVQQSGGRGPLAAGAPQAKLAIGAADDAYEREADRVAERVISTERTASQTGLMSFPAPQVPVLQRQPAGAAPPPCPTVVNFGFTEPAHVPHCGGPALRATTDVTGVTWSLTPGSAAVDPGSSIAANGTITLAATQAAGDINARATASAAAAGGCNFERPFTIRSQPVGIASTSFVSAAAGDYGGTFDHVFESADGNVASLENVGVGERFTNVPAPTAATHAIVAPLHPFGGTFTLATATLTPGATNNWFLTPAGGLGGSLDSVTTGQANINVGRFVQSASNPTLARGLPATMTLLQRLHWFCPQSPAANRWTGFVTVAHSRTLRNVGGTVEFVTTVNAVEQVDAYVGATAVSNLTATPVSTPRSAGPPTGGGAAPPARIITVTVDTLPTALPSGQTIAWSIIGTANGCTVAQDANNDHAAILTIGTTAGTVTIEAADSTGVNRARVEVVIT